jgi:hypothetical protein
MSITWSIPTLESRTADGFVLTVHYDATATNEDNAEFSENIYGSVSLPPDSELTVPYDEITEEIAVGWAKSALGEEEVERIETELGVRLDAQVAPPIVSGTPWD